MDWVLGQPVGPLHWQAPVLLHLHNMHWRIWPMLTGTIDQCCDCLSGSFAVIFKLLAIYCAVLGANSFVAQHLHCRRTHQLCRP